MEFIIENGLLVANTGNEPTFENRIRKQVLDLTLMTQSDGFKLLSWEVSRDKTFSDHKYLKFTLDSIESHTSTTFRNPRRINWSTFISTLSNNIPPLNSDIRNRQEIERISENLEMAFNVAFRSSCPESIDIKRKNPEWWHRDLENLRNSIRKALNAARKHNTDTKWETYKNKRKEFKKEIRKAKRQCFVDKLRDIETVKDTSRLRKLMSKQNYVPNNIKGANGEWTTSAKDTLVTLFDKHFPGCKWDESVNLPSPCENLNTGHNLDCDLITVDKIKWAIGTFGPYKSPGMDGIYPIMLQKSVDLISLLLVKLFRACIVQEYVPTSWRKVKVVFIPKVGKIQHCEAKDYRPISLSSFLLKTMERILDVHIRNKIQSITFSPDQHAYIKGKSVDTALHSLTSRIEQSLYQGEYSLACFLDIEGAFNNINSSTIERALNDSGCDISATIWIMKVLTQRIIHSELGGSTLEAIATRGTPQGGVISPTLWILVLNGILSELNYKGIGVVAYADDLVLLVRGKFPNTLSEVMQGALDSLYNWATNCGLGINPQKTEMVMFTKKNLPRFNPPKLDGNTLILAEKAKFLGVIFDSKLSWIPNLNERVKKSYAAIYSCQKLIGKTWGLKPRLIYWIYTAIARPILTYGSLVWWPIMNTKKYISFTERVNRVVALSITGARKSTATESLCRILDIDPLHLYIKESALRTQLRLTQSNQMIIRSTGHSSLIYRSNYANISTDYMVSQINWDKELIINIPSRENWESFNTNNNNTNDIKVYTDGSKRESGTGSGVFCERLGISYSARLNDACSIFQAEIFAVSEAARLISMRPIFRSNITLYIDSQATLKALGNRNIRSKVVNRCRRELHALNEQHFLKLCWIPGHNNFQGNRIADELARAGADMQTTSASPNVYPGLDSIYQNIRRNTKAVADVLWNDSKHCDQTKALWKPVQNFTLKRILDMEKYELRMYVGIITGHNNLKYFLKKIRLINDDTCRWCNEDVEDSFHYLCQCDALSVYRFNCFGSFFFQDLEDLCEVNPYKMLKYIKLTRLYDNLPDDQLH